MSIDRTKYPKLFMRSPCPICGKMISNCGFAYTKHDDMHKRQEAECPLTEQNTAKAEKEVRK